MIALAFAAAYLGSLAALCWYWRELRQHPSAVDRITSLETRASSWDQAVNDVENLKISAGLKPRNLK